MYISLATGELGQDFRDDKRATTFVAGVKIQAGNRGFDGSDAWYRLQ
jgi:hypothetical protein